MRGRLCCLTLAIGLVPAAAFAQDGLRSASLPEQTLSFTRRTPPGTLASAWTPPGEDVYRATVDTYRPDPARVPLPFAYSGYPAPLVYGGFPSPLMAYPVVQPIIVVQVPREAIEPPRAAPPPVLPAPLGPPAPYVAGVPGLPKTFYVIPGCYAGDRPPEPESLKPGCSISRLRVILPRP